MDSQAVAGLIGVVLGAVLGTCGTWWVSTRLERRREERRLGGVIGLLAAELTNNRDRIATHRGQVSRGGWDGLLTLGDWDANKAAFSQLMRNEPLWEKVVKTYGAIYEAISGRQEPPTPEELDEVTGQLFAARNALLRIAPGEERR
jgi:hypothetical protein